MTAEEKGFRASIEKRPTDVTARCAFADWLDERGRPYGAALQRAAAGLSEVYFKLRRKSDGLFSEGTGHTPHWSTKGKMWRTLTNLKSHMTARFFRDRYFDTPADDLEVQLVEVRPTTPAVLRVSAQPHPHRSDRQVIKVTEPLGDPTGDK